MRVLQEGEIDIIGSAESIPVDLRIVTATNKNLSEMVNKGEFRQDLFFRINVVEYWLSPFL